jgi:hypothetical protein
MVALKIYISIYLASFKDVLFNAWSSNVISFIWDNRLFITRYLYKDDFQPITNLFWLVSAEGWLIATQPLNVSTKLFIDHSCFELPFMFYHWLAGSLFYVSFAGFVYNYFFGSQYWKEMAHPMRNFWDFPCEKPCS